MKNDNGGNALKKLMTLICSAAIILAGCGSEDKKETGEKADASPKQEVKKEEPTEQWWNEEPEYYKKPDTGRELTEIENQLMRKPGPLSGDQYDVQKAKKKLDELPKDANKDEIERAILSLVHEDYHEETETFVKFDPSVNVDVSRPDEKTEEPAAKKSHFAILLDASGSMNAKNQNGTRMDEAKDALNSFIETLPGNSTLSIRVYGHKGSSADKDKELSCGNTERIYEGVAESAKVTVALDKLQAKGWTPIGKALSETKNDIPEDAAASIVYVVSDGIETCGSDPVAEAKKLADEGIQPIINIIGFQVDNEAQTLLKKVAEAGNGEFSYVDSKQELEKYWEEEYQRMMDAWDEWKAEGMKQADEKSEELMNLATETGNSIMDKSELEFKRAEELIAYLENDRKLENAGDVWSRFYDRQTDIWQYGYHTSTDNWQDSYHNGNDAWREFYNEGNAKWTEYYHKSY